MTATDTAELTVKSDLLRNLQVIFCRQLTGLANRANIYRRAVECRAIDQAFSGIARAILAVDEMDNGLDQLFKGLGIDLLQGDTPIPWTIGALFRASQEEQVAGDPDAPRCKCARGRVVDAR